MNLIGTTSTLVVPSTGLSRRPMNWYLQIAEKVLRKSRHPLSAREILEAAYRLQIVPSHLFGKTQHKTLHARLAEELGAHRRDPAFVRTGPGRFQLRARSERDTNPSAEYVAPLRSYQLKHFDVICAEKRSVASLWQENKTKVPFAQIASAFSKQMPLREAEANVNLIYLSVFVTVRTDTHFLTLVNLQGVNNLRALGLAGCVKATDADLFASEPFGIDHAARRTIGEQSAAPRLEIDNLIALVSFERLQCIRTSDAARAPTASDTVLLLTSYFCDDPDRLLHRFPPHRSPRWARVPCDINHVDGLEPISKWLISQPMAEGLATSNCSNNLF